MNIFLKTEDEIDLMREASQLVGATLAEVGKYIKDGVTTLQLDGMADEFIRDHGAIPSFKNIPTPFGVPFPACIWTSVNHVVAHGIPDKETILREGDVISVDCGVNLNGYNGDSCYTFCVGEVKPEVKTLLETTKKALYLGIEQAIPGQHVGDIGYHVQQYGESHGYGVVRELTGHGIGRNMCEDPSVPNHGKSGSGGLLKDGMCIAIASMLTLGSRKIGLMPDKWTIVSLDGKPSAHFEHTVAIHHGQVEILSTFKDIELLESNKK